MFRLFTFIAISDIVDFKSAILLFVFYLFFSFSSFSALFRIVCVCACVCLSFFTTGVLTVPLCLIILVIAVVFAVKSLTCHSLSSNCTTSCVVWDPCNRLSFYFPSMCAVVIHFNCVYVIKLKVHWYYFCVKQKYVFSFLHILIIPGVLRFLFVVPSFSSFCLLSFFFPQTISFNVSYSKLLLVRNVLMFYWF